MNAYIQQPDPKDFEIFDSLIQYQSSGSQLSKRLELLFADKMRLISMIHSGLPYTYFEKLHKVFPFTFDEWAFFLGTSTKSIQRIKRNDERFKPQQSEKIIEVAEVMKSGLAFFGNQEALSSWLREPNTAFGGALPQDLMLDSYGKQLLLDSFTRMEHGIFI